MPKDVNFSRPEEEGLPGTRNFYLETEEGIKVCTCTCTCTSAPAPAHMHLSISTCTSAPHQQVGVWHVLPHSLAEEGAARGEEWWEEVLGEEGATVVLYLHGNTAHRAGEHRKELYQVRHHLAPGT